MEDPAQRRQAKAELLALGLDVVDQLQEFCSTTTATTDLTKAYYARKAIEILNEAECIRLLDDAATDAHFKEPCSSLEFPFELGAMVVAQLEHHLLDRGHLTAQLDDLARLCQAQLQAAAEAQGVAVGRLGTRERVQCVRAVLADQCGFDGNTEFYNDPRNSFLDEVLETKRGIPISLSVLYAAVCTRLAIPLYMVGAPSHFLTKFLSVPGAGPGSESEPGPGSEAEEVFVDAFFGGRFLSRAGVAEMLSLQLLPDDPRLRPISPRQVYVRMLNNLFILFRAHTSRLLGVTRLLFHLEPSHALLKTRVDAFLALDDPDSAREELDKARALGLPDYSGLRDKVEQRAREAASAQPKFRGSAGIDVKFAVGQLVMMQEQGANGFLTGVVVGWDAIPSHLVGATRKFRFWGIPLLDADQPMYQVLPHVPNDLPLSSIDVLSVEESRLTAASGHTSSGISNPELGRFFTSFDTSMSRYVPNRILATLYPDDLPSPSL